MRVVTLLAGLGLVLAGLLAIGYGIQFKEFSFGSTLILSGVVGACSGLIMVGLWTVMREFRALAERMGTGSPVVHDIGLAPLPAAPADRGPSFTPVPASGGGSSLDSPPQSRREESAVRNRGRFDEPEPAPDQPAVSAPPKRRNLMFSSSRKDRERAPGRVSEALAPDLLSPDLRPDPPAASFESESAGLPPAEDIQPKADRPAFAEPPRRAERSTPAGSFAATSRPIVPREERPPVTVLKSGVVDGMAYTLYSDGSIEAQLPEGMMRFVSIDELRSHLEQRP